MTCNHLYWAVKPLVGRWRMYTQRIRMQIMKGLYVRMHMSLYRMWFLVCWYVVFISISFTWCMFQNTDLILCEWVHICKSFCLKISLIGMHVLKSHIRYPMNLNVDHVCCKVSTTESLSPANLITKWPCKSAGWSCAFKYWVIHDADTQAVLAVWLRTVRTSCSQTRLS